ncbi:hypothetical protein D0T25_25570 [Duganella sp. BJB488]|uniref:hypothetical protein n=1 Tax=unclassified Duganella TaxID=2636909 RepID=UPI000E343330|nr:MULTISPECIES: hypothetical protein [unclassified Duganella]NVD72923.1 hypothetical protein [Duganella sp. BJB1802]RFP11751.1 hypothetical protein D0T26_25710 [Duganella sp. BJB489]RFP15536.1 hypothetical protein D0T25_25570 [Duganella sp. BJB488]RFP30483.1 hypothetical protein D0T24_26270 [Duganella sp. BJB480]
MRKLWMLALALPLAGCYTVNQAGLGNFITQTVQPGMPLEQALVRMRAEGFYCNTSTAGTVTICTRNQERLLRGSCVERVDLVRSATSTQTLGKIDVMETRCAKL